MGILYNSHTHDEIAGLPVAASGADAHVLATDASGDISITSVIASTAIGARAYNSTAQTIATATYTVLTLDSEQFDNDNIHSTVTNTGRLTCNTAGVYIIVAQVAFKPNGVGDRGIAIRLNGATYICFSFNLPSAAAGVAGIVIATTIYGLAATDYIEMIVYQNTGGNLDENYAGSAPPVFSMVRMA